MRQWEGECACERMSVVCVHICVNVCGSVCGVCGSVCGVCIYSCECVWDSHTHTTHTVSRSPKECTCRRMSDGCVHIRVGVWGEEIKYVRV